MKTSLTEWEAVENRLIEIARGESGSEEKLREAAQVLGMEIPQYFKKVEIAIALYGFFSGYRVMVELSILPGSERFLTASSLVMAI